MPRRALLPLLLFAMLPLVSQQAPSIPMFRAFREVTKSAAAEVITVQLPPRSSKRAEFTELFVYCEADIDLTIELNGGAATQTSFNPALLNLVGASAIATPYHTSNTSGGSVVEKLTLFGSSSAFIKLPYVLASGQTLPQNLTIRTSAFTGTLRVRVEWQERP